MKERQGETDRERDTERKGEKERQREAERIREMDSERGRNRERVIPRSLLYQTTPHLILLAFSSRKSKRFEISTENSPHLHYLYSS